MHLVYIQNSSEKGLATRRNGNGLATEVADVKTLYRFTHTSGSFVLCIRVSAGKMAATGSHVLGFVYYSVCKTCVLKTTVNAER